MQNKVGKYPTTSSSILKDSVVSMHRQELKLDFKPAY